MGFVAPAFALFAVLAGVPILLHLYGRPRAQVRRFAALRFLIESDKKTAAQRKLREMLLLVARAAAIAAVSLILAKPYLETRSDVGIGGGVGERESAVIVLDDSRSMGFVDGTQTRFAAAQARARRLVDGMGRDSEVAILLTSGAAAPQGELTPDRTRLRQAIAEAHATRRPGDTSSALKRAAAILAAPGGTMRPTRRVYLVSDLAAHGFQPEPPWPAEGGPSLVPIDVGDKKPANRAVEELRVEPAPQLGPRGVQIEATVENFGDEPQKEQPLTLRIDGKAVARNLVDLPAHGRATKRFFHAFGLPGESVAPGAAGEPRAHETVVELSPDALADDDRRWLRIEERRVVRVLLVDGDPRTVRRDDELFYLETALHPGDRDDSRLEVRVASVDDLGRRPLEAEDVIFLANVKAPDTGRAAQLAAFVEGGGGLFLSVGDNVDADAWNAAFGDLLPQPLATLRTVGPTLSSRDDGEARAGGEGERVARFDRGHPVLAPFESAGGPGDAAAPGDKSAPPGDKGGRGGSAQALREARISRYALLRPTPHGAARDDERRALLRLEGGAPLLVEGRKGKGRVLLLTTTLDRDWGDLAIQPAYLPLMQQAARYLARASLDAPEPPALVGQPHDIPLGEGDSRVEVTLPSGQTRWFGEDRTLGRAALHFTDTDEPGLYHVAVGGAGGELKARPAAAFAVNVDVSESNLTRIEPAKLAALGQPSKAEAGEPPRHRIELWHGLGAALLALLLAEGLLSARLRRQPG